MSNREIIGTMISLEQSLKNNIAELEKAKYEALIRLEELKKENQDLAGQVERLTTLLQNSRAE